MMALGPLAFGAPWLLAALAALPAIWWLLRLTPPPARRVAFPAMAFLIGLGKPPEEARRTPWWLVLLRMAIAALVILALAEPILNPPRASERGQGLLLVLDDGWRSAPDWERAQRVGLALIDDTTRRGEPVTLLFTARRSAPLAPVALSGSDARTRLEAAAPAPWAPDRADAAARLAGAGDVSADRVIWLSDGIDGGDGAPFEKALAQRGPLTVAGPTGPRLAQLLLPPESQGPSPSLTILRAQAGTSARGDVVARAGDGRVLASLPFAFLADRTRSEAVVSLPPTLANDVARYEIAGARAAGSVVLIDDLSRRRDVGLVAGDASEQGQPLLADLHYLTRALSPFAELEQGTLDALLTKGRAIIVLADVGRIVGPDHDRLERWIKEGGTLVRFAGPRLAAQSDDLVPVPLRQGGRALGGALTWAAPQHLAPFEPGSPFEGLTGGEAIKVTHQVLAEPVPDLGARTWARLADGTPLVTAARRERGLIVLFHVTANTAWSDLPLSGLYVDMLRRLIALAHAPGHVTASAGASAPLVPWRTLDAFGSLGPPSPESKPLDPQTVESLVPGPDHPPGLYGPGAAPLAFNIGRPGMTLAPLAAATRSYETLLKEQSVSLKPWLLAAALLLALIDGVLALIFGGGLARMVTRLRPARAGLALLLMAALAGALLPAPAARAQDAQGGAAGDAFALEATRGFRLAYVETGNPSVDAMSAAGLAGLGRALNERTAVEPEAPLGVDLETDELAFFPLIYWQVTADQRALSDVALARLDRFMKTGGTLVIDTADEDQRFGNANGGPGQARLRTILANLDLPPLEPVQSDHVLTKSFYLLQDFPGRFAGGRVWVETAGRGADHDGVSAIVLGSNDWASAWARDEVGRPLAAVVPGGENQREMAIRFGINLVMYALTGNYKADQVHVPALLERLGQ